MDAAVLEAPQTAPEANGATPTEAPRNRGGRPRGSGQVTEKTTEEVLGQKIESVVRYAVESGFDQGKVSEIVTQEFNSYESKKTRADFNKLVQEKLASATPDELKALIASLGG